MASLPLQDYELIHASDPDYVCEMMGQIFIPHRLVLVDTKARLDARLHCRRLTNTAINFVSYGGEVLAESGPTDTFFALLMPLSGVCDFRCGGTRVVMTPTLGSVVSPSDMDLAMRWHHDAAQLICRIERVTLEAHLADVLGECPSRPLRFSPPLHVDHGGGLTVSTRLRALVRDIDRDRRLVDHPASIHAFERSLMTDLLVAQPNNYSVALSASVKAVGSRDVRHALALMESHPEWPLSVAGIAATLSVSARSLQRGFRRELDATFRGVLHDIRLRRVRDDLHRSMSGAATVHDVFARWGLPLEGYTYTAYRRRYGETPSETLRRA